MCATFYGSQFISFNVNSLIHLQKDVLNHGCLDDFSAIPLEIKLQQLENLARKSGNPLQQVVYRLVERQMGQFETHSSKLCVS